MIKHNQDGAVSGLALSLLLAVVLLLASMGFGYWAYSGRQDYKNHSDAKAAAAAKVAVDKESAVKNKQFAEEAKNPLKTYNGPEAQGSMIIQYPKTWSGYVSTSGNSATPVDGYFNPGVVPSINDQNSVFALHVQVLNQSYSDILQTFNDQLHQGKVTISAYALPKLPKVVGVRVQGTLVNQKIGTVVILPLRSQALEIETDGNQFINDFNTYILPNFSFSP
jgi:uncharacterized protein (UPF0333 family)